MALAKQVKEKLVSRLVERELRGWTAGFKAGEVCALQFLTIQGFNAVVALDTPDIKELRAALQNQVEEWDQQAAFWHKLMSAAGLYDRQICDHPDFVVAFVQRVREVWEEIQDEVLGGLKVRPEQELGEESEPEAEVPARPARRGPSNRQASRHRDFGRRM